MTDLTNLMLDAVSPIDETALRAWFDLEVADRLADRPDDPLPCWTAHRAQLTAAWPGEESRVWLAGIDGAVVGVGVLGLPQLDNPGNALVKVVVHPGHRRRGVGRRILALLGARARDAGRVRLIGDARSPLTGTSAGRGFAAAAGAREVLRDVRRRLQLPGDGEHDRAELAAQPVAAGYDLVQWTDGTPARWLHDMARLGGRMSTDAPLGDLHLEPEHWDVARVRARDAMCRARGLRLTVTAARATDGTLVAFTEISSTTGSAWHASNWDTLVQPEHRGHRLGLRVKLANLALARRRHPELTTVDTYNAEANAHMIAINESMGFRAHDRASEWELDL